MSNLPAPEPGTDLPPQPPPAPPGPPDREIEPVREPEPDRLPDEIPVPNPDEADGPPLQLQPAIRGTGNITTP